MLFITLSLYLMYIKINFYCIVFMLVNCLISVAPCGRFPIHKAITGDQEMSSVTSFYLWLYVRLVFVNIVIDIFYSLSNEE